MTDQPDTRQTASIYDALAAKGHFAPDRGNEVYAAPLILKLLQDRPAVPSTYLEIAPGGGGLARTLLLAFPTITQFTGVELSPSLAALCARTLTGITCAGIQIIQDDFNRCRHQLEPSDLVVASFVGPHLAPDYIHQLLDLTRPGGITIVLDAIQIKTGLPYLILALSGLYNLARIYHQYGVKLPIQSVLSRSDKLAALATDPDFLRLNALSHRTTDEWRTLAGTLAGARFIKLLPTTALLMVEKQLD